MRGIILASSQVFACVHFVRNGAGKCGGAKWENNMAIEQLLQAVINATPAKRRRLEAVLNGEETGKADKPADTRLVTISDTAKLLAVSRGVVYRLIEDKRLDTVVLSGCTRITMKSITEFSNGERPATEDTLKTLKKRADIMSQAGRKSGAARRK